MRNRKICLLLFSAIVFFSFPGGEEILFCEEGVPGDREEGAAKESFAFGMEYVFPMDGYQIAHHYSQIGASWAKFNGPGTLWEDVEPNPPKEGVHFYDWAKIDEAVRAMQAAGFLHLTFVIGPKSSWGSRPSRKKKNFFDRMKSATVNTLPKEEHRGDYAAWVSAFVERYDADGVDDMPGLRSPVLHYEVLTEAQHDGYWEGTAEEYIQILKTSYAAVKKACPEAQVILSGFMFMDLFDQGPLTDAQIETRLASVRENYPPLDIRRASAKRFGKQLAFNREVLKAKDYFDIVEFHLLSNYTALEGIVGWIRREMEKNGYRKPIWVGDAGALPQIPMHDRKGFGAVFGTMNQFVPPMYDDGDKIYKVLTSKKDGHGYRYKDVRRWFLKEQALFLTKSLIIEMALGLKGTHIYTWLDGRPRKFFTAHAKNWQISGLRDGNFFDEKFRFHPKVGKPRPVFYTYKLIIEKLGHFTRVDKIDIGLDDIHGYRFIVGDKQIDVLWLDEDYNQRPGQEEIGQRVDLRRVTGSAFVKATHIVVQEDEQGEKIEILPAREVLVTEAPIFIEAMAGMEGRF